MPQWHWQSFSPLLTQTLHLYAYAFTKKAGQTITTNRDYWHKIDENSMGIYALEMAMRGRYLVTLQAQLPSRHFNGPSPQT